VNLQCKNFKKAEEYLTKVISLGQTVGAEIDIATLYLAIVYEIQRNIQQSLYFYGLALKEATRLGHNFTKCGAITGLVRLKCMQKEYDKLATLWDEGEKVALQYEYHHYLASLYLSRGHVVWDASVDVWDSGFDSTLQCYQYALIHSLSYNRFLLDEILSGKELVSPYISLIPFCLEQKTNGEQMLMSIQNWWENATYTSGKVVSSTIPLLDNIPLYRG
jgi:tetratricopeptide (TPR) repeat protein